MRFSTTYLGIAKGCLWDHSHTKVSKPRTQLMRWLDGVNFDGGITGCSALFRSLFTKLFRCPVGVS